MEIVINDCYGGFGLSLIAQKEYWKRKGKEIFFYKQTKYGFHDGKDEFVRVDDLEKEESLFTHGQSVDHGEKIDNIGGNENYISSRDIDRNDPDLIAIVKEFGESANGDCASLKIVEIPDDVEWEISEYDGNETVEEKHRSWC